MRETPGRDLPGSEASRPRHRVCPWWVGYLLASPLRRIVENPERLLGPFVRTGMTVLEPGCGMGFFSLPLARLVGPRGRVICVDLQPKMIDVLRKRARRANLLDRIETVVCGQTDLAVGRWNGRIDLALAIYVVHEVPDARAFLEQIHDALREGGILLVTEPKGHVSASEFEATVAAASVAGFRAVSQSPFRKELRVVLERLGHNA